MYNIVAIVFLVLGVSAGIVSLATSHWTELEQINGHQGLFQTCKEFQMKKMIYCFDNLDVWNKDGQMIDTFIHNGE